MAIRMTLKLSEIVLDTGILYVNYISKVIDNPHAGASGGEGGYALNSDLTTSQNDFLDEIVARAKDQLENEIVMDTIFTTGDEACFIGVDGLPFSTIRPII